MNKFNKFSDQPKKREKDNKRPSGETPTHTYTHTHKLKKIETKKNLFTHNKHTHTHAKLSLFDLMILQQ